METRIKISGDGVMKASATNRCAPPELTSFEVVKNEYSIWIEHEGIEISVPRDQLVRILKFLIPDEEMTVKELKDILLPLY